MVTAPSHPNARRVAFTLIEAVLALGISAIVVAAIGGVFYSSMRLRDRSVAMIERSSRLQPVLSILKRDLLGAMPADGVLASVFRCGILDGLSGNEVGIQFVTTTGPMDPDSVSGDLQQVTYTLRDSARGKRGAKDLVRTVDRNLLATTLELPTEELLASNVEQFEIECFDGYQWRATWDTSLTDTNLPRAVKLQIQFAPENQEQAPSASQPDDPVQLIVPLCIQSRTNSSLDSAAADEESQQ